MKEMFLLKLGEIVLKGANRRTFEETLKKNVRRTVSHFGAFKVYIMQSTVYVEPQSEDCDLDGAWEACGHVFGVSSMCRCRACGKDLDAIYQAVVDYLGDELSVQKSFKVESKRSDKSFPLNSIQISQEIGGRLAEAFPQVAVDVHKPSYVVNVEVRDFAAYIHGPAQPGAGGLPTGTGGRAAVLLSGGIDSPVAGYMIAKRGVQLDAVHFYSFPHTSERAKEKVFELAAELCRYTSRLSVFVVPFTHIQEEIYDRCPDQFLTLLTRRFMMKISEKIAVLRGCGALVTGESIGQVASQTMESLHVTDSAVELPVFRPVIGMDKLEIMEIAQSIGTYETSILPFEDCCTVFTPRHPATRPKLEEVCKAEALLDCDKLIEEALAMTERIDIDASGVLNSQKLTEMELWKSKS